MDAEEARHLAKQAYGFAINRIFRRETNFGKLLLTNKGEML
jgi:hypothetical protein